MWRLSDHAAAGRGRPSTSSSKVSAGRRFGHRFRLGHGRTLTPAPPTPWTAETVTAGLARFSIRSRASDWCSRGGPADRGLTAGSLYLAASAIIRSRWTTANALPVKIRPPFGERANAATARSISSAELLWPSVLLGVSILLCASIGADAARLRIVAIEVPPRRATAARLDGGLAQ
jgi:hypothetical protein